jgi:protease-4
MLAPKMEVTEDGIGVIQMHGAMAYAPDAWEMLFDGIEDTRAINGLVNQAAASPVRGILLDINSPGGGVMGGLDLADSIARLSKEKPVVAWTGGMAASLGYMMAAQADEIVSGRSAVVGSIGVIATYQDWTKFLERYGVKMEVFTNKEATFKGAGAMGTTLNDAQREHIQARIDSVFGDFKAAVHSKRKKVEDSSMRGQTMYGAEALKAGLVDRIGDRDFAMSVLRQRVRRIGGR